MKRREEGSIEERIQGEKYLLRWSCTGCKAYQHTEPKRHNCIVNGDYIEAQAELAKILRPEPGREVKPERTFASFAETEWMDYVHKAWKPSTQVCQGSLVTKRIRPYFDVMNLADITPSHVLAFHRSLEGKIGKRTQRMLHSILTRIFNLAVEFGLIDKSPVTKSTAPTRPEQHEKPALTPEQAWDLWDALAGPETIRNRAFYGVLLFTGIRTGEALGLRWEDIDLVSRALTVKRQVYRGRESSPKTKASLRTRPMPPELYTALVNHRAMAVYTQPEDYVFCSSTGKPSHPDILRKGLQCVLRGKLGLHLGPREDGLHLLRHTSGSLVFARTGNIKETQSWLGHSSSRVTLDIYTHLMQQSQQATAEAVFSRPVALLGTDFGTKPAN